MSLTKLEVEAFNMQQKHQKVRRYITSIDDEERYYLVIIEVDDDFIRHVTKISDDITDNEVISAFVGGNIKTKLFVIDDICEEINAENIVNGLYGKFDESSFNDIPLQPLAISDNNLKLLKEYATYVRGIDESIRFIVKPFEINIEMVEPPFIFTSKEINFKYFIKNT